MDLEFSEEQGMLRELVRGVCATTSPLAVVREMEDDPTGYPADLWKQLAELDLIGLLIPSEYGGSGMTALEGVVVYEELGRALAPTPHFVSAVMAAGVIARAGTEEQQRDWLPRIASGDAIVTTAWLEPHGGFGPEGVHLQARADGDAFVLDGSKRHVPFASAAGHLLVLARTGDAPTDVDLFLVDGAAAGVVLTQQLTIASDAQYDVDFTGARVPAANRIGGAGTGWTTWHDTMLDGIILLAAQAMGGARYALDITVQYAKDRHQFDKPLGAFQALAHYLADASTAVDGGTVLVHEAAWARAEGRSVSRLAPMAKLFACQTFRDVTAMAQQIFGGVGFTLEYDIQLYFRRAKQLQVSWWNDRYLEELVAAETLDRPADVVRLPAPWRGPQPV
ncbi:MAG TPA: acyl-CoA dehydrogenase family protein [Acidimicrobiia bacterium]|jgi:alkylation response protein AidB-like acyl-CoA dehydrogenase